MLQPYLDRELTEAERAEAERHLEACPPCQRAYRFEESLRKYVRKSCTEQMSDELKEKLAALRTAF
jgi:mycothiol system anti-sigma-R factor